LWLAVAIMLAAGTGSEVDCDDCSQDGWRMISPRPMLSMLILPAVLSATCTDVRYGQGGSQQSLDMLIRIAHPHP